MVNVLLRKFGKWKEHWKAGVLQTDLHHQMPGPARQSAPRSDNSMDQGHFPWPFQSGYKQWRCSVLRPPCWRTASSSAPSQKVSYSVLSGYCLFPDAHPLKTLQIWPLFTKIIQRLSQGGFRWSSFRLCPCQQSVHHRFGPGQTLDISFFWRQIRQLLFDSEENIAVLQPLQRRAADLLLFWQGIHRFVKLPPQMRPAANHPDVLR